MAESAHNLLLVQIARRRLQPANGLHLRVQLERLFLGDRTRGGWAIVQVVQFKGLCVRVFVIIWRPPTESFGEHL